MKTTLFQPTIFADTGTETRTSQPMNIRFRTSNLNKFIYKHIIPLLFSRLANMQRNSADRILKLAWHF